MGCLLMFSTGENKELIYNLCIWLSAHFNNMFKQDFLWVQWLVDMHKHIYMNFSKGVRYSHILLIRLEIQKKKLVLSYYGIIIKIQYPI